ncbi:MAG: sugar phosphate isomerase/epimerase, partial [Clostridia bacterium]|nr:sugar phosphate isomerase/epimerase [Clostridia bacterium]
MKIGAMVESFRLGFRGGVEKAAALGVAGIQKYATGEELNWTDAQIREALDIVKSNGLVFSAICGDFGYGFDNPERNPEMIEKSKRVLDIAKKLECDIVTTHIHKVPAE